MAASGNTLLRSGALGLIALVCGCGDGVSAPGNGGQESPVNAGSSMPPIYADLLEEELYKGQNSEKRDYQGHLKRCQDAGFPTTPLTPEQVEQLGTTRVQMWFEQGREIIRSETWVFRVGEEGIGTCHFQLIRSGNQSYNDAQVSRVTDLESGEVSSEPPQAYMVNRVAIEVEGGLAQIASKENLAVPASRTLAGVQCTQWTDPRFFGRTICLWAGGRAWGFDDTDSSSGCGANHTYRIVLSEEPLSGSGCRITARRFTVGRPISPDEYQLAPATGASQ